MARILRTNMVGVFLNAIKFVLLSKVILNKYLNVEILKY